MAAMPEQTSMRIALIELLLLFSGHAQVAHGRPMWHCCIHLHLPRKIGGACAGGALMLRHREALNWVFLVWQRCAHCCRMTCAPSSQRAPRPTAWRRTQPPVSAGCAPGPPAAPWAPGRPCYSGRASPAGPRAAEDPSARPPAAPSSRPAAAPAHSAVTGSAGTGAPKHH